jgi:hypothetical protein
MIKSFMPIVPKLRIRVCQNKLVLGKYGIWQNLSACSILYYRSAVSIKRHRDAPQPGLHCTAKQQQTTLSSRWPARLPKNRLPDRFLIDKEHPREQRRGGRCAYKKRWGRITRLQSWFGYHQSWKLSGKFMTSMSPHDTWGRFIRIVHFNSIWN